MNKTFIFHVRMISGWFFQNRPKAVNIEVDILRISSESWTNGLDISFSRASIAAMSIGADTGLAGGPVTGVDSAYSSLKGPTTGVITSFGEVLDIILGGEAYEAGMVAILVGVLSVSDSSDSLEGAYEGGPGDLAGLTTLVRSTNVTALGLGVVRGLEVDAAVTVAEGRAAGGIAAAAAGLLFSWMSLSLISPAISGAYPPFLDHRSSGPE